MFSLTNINMIAEIVGAFGTLLLAFFVYRTSKFISRNEAITALSNGWTAYNQAMLENENLTAFNEFLAGEEQELGMIRAEKHVHFLLYLLLNCLNSTYHATKSGVLDDTFSEDILDDYLTLLYNRRKYVVSLVARRGYDAEFKQFIQKRFDEI